jgi:hypothetical protein
MTREVSVSRYPYPVIQAPGPKSGFRKSMPHLLDARLRGCDVVVEAHFRSVDPTFRYVGQ